MAVNLFGDVVVCLISQSQPPASTPCLRTELHLLRQGRTDALERDLNGSEMSTTTAVETIQKRMFFGGGGVIWTHVFVNKRRGRRTSAIAPTLRSEDQLSPDAANFTLSALSTVSGFSFLSCWHWTKFELFKSFMQFTCKSRKRRSGDLTFFLEPCVRRPFLRSLRGSKVGPRCCRTPIPFRSLPKCIV